MEIEVVRRELDEAAVRIQAVVNQELEKIMQVYQFSSLGLNVDISRVTSIGSQDSYISEVSFIAQL